MSHETAFLYNTNIFFIALTHICHSQISEAEILCNTALLLAISIIQMPG